MYTPEVAVFASWLLIQYYSGVCTLGEFCHKRYNFINQRSRTIIKKMRAPDNWPLKLMVFHCRLWGYRPGELPEGSPKMTGWSGWGGWAWSCWRTPRRPPCAHAGPWPRPTTRWPGTACPAPASSFRLGSGGPAHRKTHAGISNSSRASLLSFANFRGREIKRQIKEAHVAGKASTLTLLVDLSLVDWSPGF